MAKRVRILFVFICLSLTMCIMSNTYSRYVAGTTGNLEVLFAKWQILLNGEDITSNNTSITLTPTIEESEYVAAGKLAPSSKGYFDIEIDPTNVDVSYNYQIDLSYDTTNLPDILISKYAILDEDYIDGDEITYLNIFNNQITGTYDYDNTIENFSHDAFTIRIFFEWFDGEDENMDDQADSVIGNNAANEINTSFEVTADISFEQKLS